MEDDMNIKGRMMAGAALAAGLLMTAPAMAQSDRYYNTNSTPDEQAQTNQLNDKAAAQANQDADANDAAHADYDAKSAAYQQQLDRYRAQQEDYNRARAHYDHERDMHDNHGRTWNAFYGHDNFQDVALMHGDDLIGKAVVDVEGREVGRIRDIDRVDGVMRVGIRVDDREVAWIRADHVRFDPDAGVAVTDFTPSEVRNAAVLSHPRF
jgi:hypothetical protein